MENQHDYNIDMFLFHSELPIEEPMKRYSTVTSMPIPPENEHHRSLSPKDPGSSWQTYEIVMLSLCGSIFLLAMMIIALQRIRNKHIIHFQSQGRPTTSTTDLPAEETVAEDITTKHNEGGTVFTAQIMGPACVTHVSEKEQSPVAVPAAEGKPNSNTMLPFSLASSMTPSPEQCWFQDFFKPY